jgi:hypothetical protein
MAKKFENDKKFAGASALPGQFMADDSPEAMAFWLVNGEVLTDIAQRIGRAFKEHDGNALLLFDSALRGLVDNIADGWHRHKVRFEAEEK